MGNIMLRHTTYTIRPMWAGMGTWTYIGDCETECDGHNKKMWHYLIAPDNTRISIDEYFSPYKIPSWEELEDLMIELPEVRNHLK
tara:strand:+ start:800 stop:1054 length:255 start_codon:yes stop_codon:yes gene_type:complete